MIELPPGSQMVDENLSPPPDPDVRQEYLSFNEEAQFRLADILGAGWRIVGTIGPNMIQVGNVFRNGRPQMAPAWLFFFQRERPDAVWPQVSRATVDEYTQKAQALGEAFARAEKAAEGE